MKVLHLIKTADGAMWAYRQIKVLIEEGVEVAVCLPAGKMADKYRADGIKVYAFNFTITPVKMLSQFASFKKIIKDYKPDLVHSHFILTTLFARLYRFLFSLKIPLIFQVPGPLHLEHSLFRNADLRTGNKYDRWVGSCTWTSNKYISCGIPKERVFMSFYGTDTNFVKKMEPGKLRSELGFKDDDFIVAIVAYMYKPKGYIGQTKGIKGHEDFFEAAAKCIQQNKKIKPVVIGGAWGDAADYEQKLVRMGKELCGDNIYFLGSRNDIPELYADIDLVVHPSYSENLGGAMESLLLEVPTIATSVGGFPDIVINDETGYLVTPGAVDEIAERIMYAYSHQQEMKAMAVHARKKLLKMLDVNTTGREIFAIYNKILNIEPEHVQVL